MLLTYHNDETDERTAVTAEVTTEHPASHYGQAVLVLEDGGALDPLSWAACDYQVTEATPEELRSILDLGFPVDLGGLLFNHDSRFGDETLIATRERWEELLRPRCAEWFRELEEGQYAGTPEEWTEDALDRGLREVHS
jgi:hypothetical protein